MNRLAFPSGARPQLSTRYNTKTFYAGLAAAPWPFQVFLAGAWDPSFALVMGSAILAGRVRHGRAPVTVAAGASDNATQHPQARRLGPAIVLMGAGIAKTGMFRIAMLAEMGVFELLNRRAA